MSTTIPYKYNIRLDDSIERSFTLQLGARQAIISPLGIYMVTSGCPIMNKLRPMVRFHPPFATIAETASPRI